MATTTPNTSHRPFIGPLRLTLKTLRLALLLVMSVVLIPLAPLLGTRRAPALVGWWHGRLLRVLNIKVRVRGPLPRAPSLIATNHTTWLDIVVLGHVFDAAFISKAEVGRWPVIGVYARAMGTLFLSRGAHRTDDIRQQIHATFAHGRSVVLFPEGTTSATLPPRRFHARLFSAALDGGHPVLPVAMRYNDAETPSGSHHPLVPWVDARLLPNFVQIFRLPGLQVDMNICPTIGGDDHSRRSLADASHDAISDCLSASRAQQSPF